MEVNTFHLIEMINNSKVSINELSRITNTSVAILKAIKIGRKWMLNINTYTKILNWYWWFLKECNLLYNTNALFLNQKKWLQDNQ